MITSLRRMVSGLLAAMLLSCLAPAGSVAADTAVAPVARRVLLERADAVAAAGRTLRKGTGDGVPGGDERVRVTQRVLGALGYPLGRERRSGRYGVRTEGAIGYFQRGQHLRDTGDADPRTLHRLADTLGQQVMQQSPGVQVEQQDPRSGIVGFVRDRWVEGGLVLAVLLVGALALSPDAARVQRRRRGVHAVVGSPRPPDRRPLGVLLVEAESVSPPELEHALTTQARHGGRLGTVLQREGAVAPADLRAALSRQAGVRTLADGVSSVPRLPEELARAARAVALRATDGGHATPVAVTDAAPEGLAALSDVLGTPVRPELCDDQTLDGLLIDAYGRDDARGAAKLLARRRSTVLALLGLAALVTGLAAGQLAPVAFVLAGLAAAAHGMTAVRGLHQPPVFTGAVQRLSRSDAPEQTLVVPLYRASPAAINACARTLRTLDYPATRLQGLVLVAEGDHETLDLARRADLPGWAQVLEVPVLRRSPRSTLTLQGARNARGDVTVLVDPEAPLTGDVLRHAAARLREQPTRMLSVRPGAWELSGGIGRLPDLWRRPRRGTDHVVTAALHVALGWATTDDPSVLDDVLEPTAPIVTEVIA